MGALFSALMSLVSARQEYKLVIVGLDNAGKTTTLYKLHLGEVVMTQPTIGSNVEEVRYKNVHFEVWDLGGQQTLRNSWQSYYRNAAAVIMMVDSTDRGRMGLVKDELFMLLGCEELSGSSVLVLANKQDLPDAMTVAELSEALQLHTIKGHEWHIQSACALTGE
eukprot:CAMPEP_0197577646 /NCGR_PEP_ID=MMETSP1326-20131121/2200_1 /TAXON_ID=1155430 /ORGANISM="Genus nov. species nov., Strain RCC2288" /LENGTH=164 /DNA_ID=CAMNT_0043140745 /DNA_START=201 /DNA_END=692 /DNA_ORIENTATION=+